MIKKFLLFLLIIPLFVFSESIFYIDPSIGNNGNGSIDSPFKGWEYVSISNNNTYLQKRGTIYYLDDLVLNVINCNQADDIFIGAYGSGDENPIIWDNSTSDAAAFEMGNCINLIIDSYDIIGGHYPAIQSSAGISGGASMWEDPRLGSHNITISNCLIDGFFNGIRLISYKHDNITLYDLTDAVITKTTIKNIWEDGIFLKHLTGANKDSHAATISYCNIHDINQKALGTDDTGGDCLQFTGCMEGLYYIHHNKFDKSNTFGKFAAIHNTYNVLYPNGWGTGATIYYEYNTMISGKTRTDLTYGAGQAMYCQVHHYNPPSNPINVYIRYNDFYGESDNNCLALMNTDHTNIHNVFIDYNKFNGFGTGTVGEGYPGRMYANNNIFNLNGAPCLKYNKITANNNILINDNSDVAIKATAEKETFNNLYSIADASMGVNDIVGNATFIDSSGYYLNHWLQNWEGTVGTLTKDYRVDSTSITINAGIFIPTNNFDFDSIFHNDIIDIGTNEYKYFENELPDSTVIDSVSFPVYEKLIIYEYKEIDSIWIIDSTEVLIWVDSSYWNIDTIQMVDTTKVIFTPIDAIYETDTINKTPF